MKSLIVYYSRTGNTKNIAETICRKLGADIEEIIDHKNRKGFFGFLLSGNEAFLKKTVPIEELKNDITQYDLLIIGTPIWAGNISTPVNSLLKKYSDKIEEFAFFSTSTGPDSQKALLNLEQIVPHKPIASVNIGYRDIKIKSHLKKIDEFLATIRVHFKK